MIGCDKYNFPQVQNWKRLSVGKLLWYNNIGNKQQTMGRKYLSGTEASSFVHKKMIFFERKVDFFSTQIWQTNICSCVKATQQTRGVDLGVWEDDIWHLIRIGAITDPRKFRTFVCFSFLWLSSFLFISLPHPPIILILGCRFLSVHFSRFSSSLRLWRMCGHPIFFQPTTKVFTSFLKNNHNDDC